MANNSTSLPMCSIKITEGIYLETANTQIFKTIFMPSFVFTTIMFLIGVPGNALVFYIYFAKWRKTTGRIFILALTAFDMINCFFTMPMELAVLSNFIMFDHGSICKYFRYVTFMMNSGSSFVLAGIAIDRYIRICMPFRPQLRTKHAKVVVFIALIMSVVFAWPALLLYGTQTIPITVPGKLHICIIGKTCLYEDHFLATSYPLIFNIVLLIGNIIIDIGLITCYSLIGYQVIKRGRAVEPTPSVKMRKASISTMSTDDNILDYKRPEERELHPLSSPENSVNVSAEKNEKQNSPDKTKCKVTMQSSASKKRDTFRQRSLSVSSIEARRTQMYKTTSMLFMVTLLFMGSFVPYCVIVMIRLLNKDYYYNLTSIGKAVYNLFLRFYMLSSSLNPVIYCFMTIQFRQQCKDFFKQIKCRRK